MRAIARRNARARAFLRRPFPGARGGAELEERYARELVGSLGGEPARGPRFVFGASGLILSGLAAGWEECVEWDLRGAGHPPGYEADLVAEVDRRRAHRPRRLRRGRAGGAGEPRLPARRRGAAGTGPGGGEGDRAGPTGTAAPALDERRAGPRGARRQRSSHRGRPAAAATRSSWRPRSPAAALAELTALLDRHRPLLHYDSLESFRADSAATICDLVAPGRCNSLHRADGSLIAAAAPGGGGRPARARLPRAAAPTPTASRRARATTSTSAAAPTPRTPWRCAGWRAMATSSTAAAAATRRGGSGSSTGSSTTTTTRACWGWSSTRATGRWCSCGSGRTLAPEAATFARHAGAERLGWDEVELADGGDGPAPVVYPARGSHASLPRPGSFAAAVVARPQRRPRPAGAAARWGRSPTTAPAGCCGRGAGARPGAASTSRPTAPRPARAPPVVGPGRAPPRSAADGPKVEPDDDKSAPSAGGAGARGSRCAGRGSWRWSRIASGSRRRGEGAGALRRRAVRRRRRGPSAARSLAVEGREGSFALPLPDGREWSGLRASVVSDHGVAGETVAATFA